MLRMLSNYSKSNSYIVFLILFLIISSGVYFFGYQPRTNTNECAVDFVEYISSEYEALWESNAPDWGKIPCDHAKDSDVLELLERWIGETKKSFTQIDTAIYLGEPFSHFKYRDCKGIETTVPIEPFALVGRHPFLCTTGKKMIRNKEYLFLNGHVHGTSGRNYYFDLGASTWLSGIGGTSQKFIYETYSRFGIKFDGIYAWEATSIDHIKIWSEIPAAVKHIYHWFNVPANSKIDHPDNPLEMIKKIVKPNDFLIFKLDIDNAIVEDQFISQIMADPSISSLIDEMFFEHHINMEPLASCCWQTIKSNVTMVESAKIFLGLRRKGIRIHVWV